MESIRACCEFRFESEHGENRSFAKLNLLGEEPIKRRGKRQADRFPSEPSTDSPIKLETDLQFSITARWNGADLSEIPTTTIKVPAIDLSACFSCCLDSGSKRQRLKD